MEHFSAQLPFIGGKHYLLAIVSLNNVLALPTFLNGNFFVIFAVLCTSIDGNEELRPKQIEHLAVLITPGVTANVQWTTAIDFICRMAEQMNTLMDQFIADLLIAKFVARNGSGAYNYGVAFVQLDVLMCTLGHPLQGRTWLALPTGADH